MTIPKTLPQVKHKFKEYLGTENDPPSVSVTDYFKERSSSNIGVSVSGRGIRVDFQLTI